jgi:ADP-heptose:LPS heptosyltransferase
MGVPQAEIPRARLAVTMSPEAMLLPGAYAVLHPFASEPQKTWPAARFVEVAGYLRDKAGLEPVFLAGPSDDASPFAGLRVIRDVPLAHVKTVVAGAQLFIGNDSGPAHIAAAFGIPVVVLFGPSDPVNWAPWRTEAQVLTNSEAIDRIDAAQVMAAADALRVRA